MKNQWVRWIGLWLIAWMACATAHAQLNTRVSAMGFSWESPLTYIRLEVENPTIRELTFSLSLEGWRNSTQIEVYENQTIGPGQTLVTHLPVIDTHGESFGVHCRIDGEWSRTTAYSRNEYAYLNIAGIEWWLSAKQQEDVANAITGRSQEIVAQLEPQNAPELWQCFTPYKAVLVREADFSRINSAATAALLKWVDAGGILFVYSTGADQDKSQMLGMIHYRRSNPLFTPAGELKDISYDGTPWVDRSGLTYFEVKAFPFAIPRQGADKGVLALAGLFFLVAGPINLFYLKRRNRIRLLLVTVPVLSVLFCAMMVLFFVATQGFIQRGGSFSLTLIDEAENKAMTMAHHTVLTGLYPINGFGFDRETLFFPMETSDDWQSYRMDLTSGQRLAAGLLKPSINFHYFTMQHEPTRERLMVDWDELEVTNGFEQHLKGLALRNGSEFYYAEDLEPGQRAKLRRAEKDNLLLGDWLDERQDRAFSEFREYLQKFTRGGDVVYAAVTEGDAPDLDTGVSIRGEECHVLVGHLEPAAVEAEG